MLNEEQIKQAKKLLNLKDKDSIILFGSRLANWIEKEKKISTITIIRGINLILKDLQNKEIKEAQKVKKINIEKTKNPIVIAHGKEILELNKNGLGARRISKYILEKYHKKISYGTIYNFLKQQGVNNG